MNEREIFDAALLIPNAESRSAYVRQACGNNAPLCEQIEGLLLAEQMLGSFLQVSPAAIAIGGSPTIDQPVNERPGAQIGPYKLLQQIGEGGMGTVYMAEQTQPVQRKVALKVIKPGMDSHQVIARFEAERQALAMMDHVNIARVLDAGTTGHKDEVGRMKDEMTKGTPPDSSFISHPSSFRDSGRPYFVMELIHGVPITKYCDDNHLTPRQRLELFVPVCQAIQHAHQKGIIHRDIKPSNVMVTLYDGKPVPKVIDFGVAKATEQKLTERTLFTQYGTMVGTLEYMSPEQAEMSALGIDTRSDIFSLGVLLYELLTGSTPLSRQQMKEAAYGEILRMIKEEEPPKPSTRLSDSGQALASISAQRHTEPAKLSKMMRGELDWIVMKTLEKDRNRRYETANGLAADVLRYLNDEPVQACPPSAGYRFRKFARRNKGALAVASAAALVVLVAVIGLAVSNVLITRETNEKQIALQDKQEALNSARTNYQEASRQEALAKDNEKTANEQRREAQENLKDALAAVDQMLTRVAQERLANVPQMEPIQRELMQDALKFYQKFLQRNSDDPVIQRETAVAYRRLADIHRRLGQYAEAEQGYLKAFAMFAELQSPLDPSVRRDLSLAHLEISNTFYHLGKGEDHEKHVRRAVEIAEDLVKEYPKEPNYSDQLAYAAMSLAVLIAPTEPQEAEKILRRNLSPMNDSDILACNYRALANLLVSQGRNSEAEQAVRQSLELYEKLESVNPSASWVQWHLGETLQQLANTVATSGRLPEAVKICGRSISVLDKLATDYPAGPDYRANQALVHQEHARLLRKLNRTAEAEKAYRRALELFEKLAADFPTINAYPQTASDQRLNLGQFLVEAGRAEDALDVYREMVDHSEKRAASAPTKLNHWHGLVRTHVELGRMLEKTGKKEEAETAFRRAVEIQEKLEKDFGDKPEDRRELAQSHYQTGNLLRDAGRTQEAEKLYRLALVCYETLAVDLPTMPEYRAQLSCCHAEWAYLRKDTNPLEAENAYRKAIVIQEKLVADYPDVGEYRTALADRYMANLPPGSLGEFLFLAGRTQESAAAARKALEILDELPAVGPGDSSNKGHHLRLLAFRLWELGQRHESEKLFREAAAVFEKLTTDVPEDSLFPAYHAGSLGDIGRLLKDAQPVASRKAFEEALPVYERMIATFSPEPGRPLRLDVYHRHVVDGAHRQRAQILQRLGRLAEAEEGYRQAIMTYAKADVASPNIPELRVDLASFHADLSNLLQTVGRSKEAEIESRNGVAIREKLAADFPDVRDYRHELGRSHNGLGILLAGTGRLQEAEYEHHQALDLYEKLIQEVDHLAAHWHRRELAWTEANLGSVLDKSRRPKDAEQAFRHGIVLLEKLDTDFPNQGYPGWLANAYNRLALLLSATGQSQEVEKLYQKVLELQPDSALAMNNLAWLLATCPDAKLCDPARAVELVKKAVELTPIEGSFWNTLGIAHYRDGDFNAAIEALKKSGELLTGQQFSFNGFFLAMAHWRLDHLEEAREWQDQAVDWMEKNDKENEELIRFRDEAIELLKEKP